MKDTSKEILAAAIGIAAGSALGVLMTNQKNHPDNHKPAGSACQGRKRERLFLVKINLKCIGKDWTVI
jgi:hypothetical protein